MRTIAEILHWPGGYAMSLGWDSRGVVRCCSGHDTPEKAKAHGLEVASRAADVAVAAWDAEAAS